MREIVRPHQAANIAHILHPEGNPVVLERHIDVVVEIVARHPLERRRLHPVAMTLVGMVHAIHVVRNPARIGLDADNLEVGEAIEDTAEYESAHHVLAATNDREEAVDTRTPDLPRKTVRFAGQDVERERHVALDSGRPDLVVYS